MSRACQGDPTDLPVRLCAAISHCLTMDGAAISLLTDSVYAQFLGASHPAALQLENVQFAVSEGPGVTAAATGQPVIVPDLHHVVTPWPFFGSLAREQLRDVGAIYALPLMIGGNTVGTVTLFRHEPGRPATDLAELSDIALVTATGFLWSAFQPLTGTGELPPWEPTSVLAAHWGAAHCAAGALAEQEGITAEDALARIRGRAFASDRTVPEVSADIISAPPDPRSSA
ncbi:GAF domain-containing protein [Streptomyces sp. NPDC006733]|uniref:GAF domain-containing protein n=1 Tax=Streptomyces sp. NPDC006733 TaxID=3155460 RepID=UPI0033CF3D37